MNIAKVIADCQKKLGTNLMVVVEFNNRFTTTFGDAYYFHHLNIGRIRLNPKLWQKASEEEKINTVVHEFCHVVNLARHQRCGHGQAWRSIHQQCGHTPRRCHTVDVTEISRRRHTVICPTCQSKYYVTRTIVNRLMGGTQYACTKCKSRLHYNDVQGVIKHA